MATKLTLAQKWKNSLSDLLGPQTLSAAPEYDNLAGALSETLESYLDENAIFDIYQATIYSAEAHKGQKRTSGEDFIYHPIAVARILGEMRMDSRTIMAAVLHDVVEDTDTTLEELATTFGDDIAHLVDGVSKVSQFEQSSRESAEAASFRKMFMAMAKDVRVILIKLADRLHNMDTIESLSSERRRRIARQTLEIYAPMANRLGMSVLAQKLEDRSFVNLYPKRHRAIEKYTRGTWRGWKNPIKEASNTIRKTLELNNIDVEVHSNKKSVYHIYCMMQRKNKSLRDIKELFAIHVIIPSRSQCYQALGIIHELYNPRPQSFKDYIAIPKTNGYQSLHTTVVGPEGQPVEIKIRSQVMHQHAENGVASHWIYKTETTEKDAPQKLAQKWLDSFLEAQQMSSDSGEYLEHLKAHLSPDEVFVFTPKGEIKRLPRGATALDFAYSVHSDVGSRCIGATINQVKVPLHEKLHNGDHVEITKSRKGRPIPAWLNYTVTSRARASIRHSLSKQKANESLRLGRKLLYTALSNQGYRRVLIPNNHKSRLLSQLKLEKWEILLREIGYGNRLSVMVAKQLIAASSCEHDLPDSKRSRLTIEGTEYLLITYSECCYPIPGDKIIGTTSRGTGLVVHRVNCSNMRIAVRNPDNFLHLNWSENISEFFQVRLHILSDNQPGVLASISNIIAKYNANINNANVVPSHRDAADMTFIIEVTDRNHLAKIMRNINSEYTVSKIYRQ